MLLGNLKKMKKILLFQIYLVTSQNLHAEFYNLMCNMFFSYSFFWR